MRDIRIKTGGRGCSGFTLTELMVASAISILLGMMLVSFLTEVLGSWSRTSSRDEAYSEARAALQLMGRELDAMFTGSNAALITDLSLPSGHPEEGIGFLCKVKTIAQPANDNISNVCAVAYYLSPISSAKEAPRALFRVLLPSRGTFDRMTSTGSYFPDPLRWDTPNAEIVAQNVIDFSVKLRREDFTEVPSGSSANATPALLEVNLKVIGGRTAKTYFRTGATQELKDRISLQEGRTFTLRHRL